MNKVIEKEKKVASQMGSIWKNDDNNELFILAQVATGQYSAISLRDGNRWSDPSHLISNATDGLTLVSDSAEITVSY